MTPATDQTCPLTPAMTYPSPYASTDLIGLQFCTLGAEARVRGRERNLTSAAGSSMVLCLLAFFLGGEVAGKAERRGGVGRLQRLGQLVELLVCWRVVHVPVNVSQPGRGKRKAKDLGAKAKGRCESEAYRSRRSRRSGMAVISQGLAL